MAPNYILKLATSPEMTLVLLSKWELEFSDNCVLVEKNKVYWIVKVLIPKILQEFKPVLKPKMF